MISSVCWMMRTAMSFCPELRPFLMRQHARRSTIGQVALRKRFTW